MATVEESVLASDEEYVYIMPKRRLPRRVRGRIPTNVSPHAYRYKVKKKPRPSLTYCPGKRQSLSVNNRKSLSGRKSINLRNLLQSVENETEDFPAIHKKSSPVAENNDEPNCSTFTDNTDCHSESEKVRSSVKKRGRQTPALTPVAQTLPPTRVLRSHTKNSANKSVPLNTSAGKETPSIASANGKENTTQSQPPKARRALKVTPPSADVSKTKSKTSAQVEKPKSQKNVELSIVETALEASFQNEVPVPSSKPPPASKSVESSRRGRPRRNAPSADQENPVEQQPKKVETSVVETATPVKKSKLQNNVETSIQDKVQVPSSKPPPAAKSAEAVIPKQGAKRGRPRKNAPLAEQENPIGQQSKATGARKPRKRATRRASEKDEMVINVVGVPKRNPGNIHELEVVMNTVDECMKDFTEIHNFTGKDKKLIQKVRDATNQKMTSNVVMALRVEDLNKQRDRLERKNGKLHSKLVELRTKARENGDLITELRKFRDKEKAEDYFFKRLKRFHSGETV